MRRALDYITITDRKENLRNIGCTPSDHNKLILEAVVDWEVEKIKRADKSEGIPTRGMTQDRE